MGSITKGLAELEERRLAKQGLSTFGLAERTEQAAQRDHSDERERIQQEIDKDPAAYVARLAAPGLVRLAENTARLRAEDATEERALKEIRRRLHAEDAAKAQRDHGDEREDMELPPGYVEQWPTAPKTASGAALKESAARGPSIGAAAAAGLAGVMAGAGVRATAVAGTEYSSDPVEMQKRLDARAELEALDVASDAELAERVVNALRQRDTRSDSHRAYDQLLEETFAAMRKLGELKGGEYAGDQDRLANFRRNAANLGLQMDTVWAVYAGKHWDAIMQNIKDREKGTSREVLESIEGRIDDLLVYLILFKFMVKTER